MYQLEDFKQYSDVDNNSPEAWGSHTNCDQNNDYDVPEATFTPLRPYAISQERSSCQISRNHVSSWEYDPQPQLHYNLPESFSWTPATQTQLESNSLYYAESNCKSGDLSASCSIMPGYHTTPPAYSTNSRIGSNQIVSPHHNLSYDSDQQIHSNCSYSCRQMAGNFQPYTFSRSFGLKPVCMQTVDSFYGHPKFKVLEQQDRIRKKKASLSERKRLESVNSALELLRLRIPFEKQRHHKMSKVKILRFATEYIKELSSFLEKMDK